MKGEWVRRPQNGMAVVFLHGVLSSSEACWQHANGTYWPALLASDVRTNRAGIYVFSYRTNIFSKTYRLGDAVDALKEHLRLDGLFNCHTLVFVAHSMGGLVARKLVVERVVELRDKDICVGLFLLASPSLGAGYANMLEPLARLFGHSQADALRFSENNAWLMDLDKEFLNLKEAETIKLVGKELVEDVFIIFDRFVRSHIVPSFSGIRYFGEPFKVPDSNHFSIAKPDSAEAIQHRLLVQFISEIAAAEMDELPIEQELRGRLEAWLRACEEAELPFRTYHKLAAVFAMRSRFAASCFNSVGEDTAAKIDDWLRGTILSQTECERGLGARIVLAQDDAVSMAAAIARKEGAEEIDERHLLLAMLQDRSKGTLREICKRLGEKSLESIYRAAKLGRPRRIPPDASVVPSLKF